MVTMIGKPIGTPATPSGPSTRPITRIGTVLTPMYVEADVIPFFQEDVDKILKGCNSFSESTSTTLQSDITSQINTINSLIGSPILTKAQFLIQQFISSISSCIESLNAKWFRPDPAKTVLTTNVKIVEIAKEMKQLSLTSYKQQLTSAQNQLTSVKNRAEFESKVLAVVFAKNRNNLHFVKQEGLVKSCLLALSVLQQVDGILLLVERVQNEIDLIINVRIPTFDNYVALAQANQFSTIKQQQFSLDLT
jgi:hypothetical protein